MAVKRIVPNIAADALGAAEAFYTGVLDLEIVMDLGWIQTFASTGTAPAQISVATQGGSGMTVPDFSIEVDNFEDVCRRLRAAGSAIVYGPVREPWGVDRLYVRDPFGRLVNIVSHAGG